MLKEVNFVEASKTLVLMLAVLTVPALADEVEQVDLVAIANPSSVYCSALGYTCEDEYCIFPDGSSCPTWDFYRGKCGQSFTYCEQQGNRIESRVEDMGTWTCEYAVCVFGDSSECLEQSYFDGVCEPSQCSRWTMMDGCNSSIEFKGLISLVAHINNSSGQTAEDVLGWDVRYMAEDGKCYSYYAAEPPLIGTTEPVEIRCPMGVRSFDSYMVDYKEAIEILHTLRCGSTFIEMELYWPVVPEADEPEWHITTDIGNEIVIGANSEETECRTVG